MQGSCTYARGQYLDATKGTAENHPLNDVSYVLEARGRRSRSVAKSILTLN